MGGAGGFPAGSGPSGSGPPTISSAPTSKGTALAPAFDPYNLVYPFDPATNQIVATHPVWQRTALALGIRRGALRSSPNVGIPLDRIRNATERTAQKECEDAVRIALADLLSAGDVLVVAVTPVLPWAGKWFTDVRNLRDPKNKQPLTFPSPSS